MAMFPVCTSLNGRCFSALSVPHHGGHTGPYAAVLNPDTNVLEQMSASLLRPGDVIKICTPGSFAVSPCKLAMIRSSFKQAPFHWQGQHSVIQVPDLVEQIATNLGSGLPPSTWFNKNPPNPVSVFQTHRFWITSDGWLRVTVPVPKESFLQTKEYLGSQPFHDQNLIPKGAALTQEGWVLGVVLEVPEVPPASAAEEDDMEDREDSADGITSEHSSTVSSQCPQPTTTPAGSELSDITEEMYAAMTPGQQFQYLQRLQRQLTAVNTIAVSAKQTALDTASQTSEDVKEIKKEVTVVKRDVTEVKKNITEVKKEVKEVKEEVNEVKEEVKKMRTSLKTLLEQQIRTLDAQIECKDTPARAKAQYVLARGLAASALRSVGDGKHGGRAAENRQKALEKQHYGDRLNPLLALARH